MEGIRFMNPFARFRFFLRNGWLAGCLLLAAPGLASGQEAEPINLNADRMEYAVTDQGKVLIAIGNVVLEQMGQKLQADFIQYNPESREALARGNVLLTRPDGTVWKGEQLNHNFMTGIGAMSRFHLKTSMVNVYAEGSEILTPDHIRVRKLALTPCEEKDRNEFEITGSSAEIRDRRYVSIWNSVVWLGPVPVFYWPYLRRDLESSGRFDVQPGYSSRLGAFIIPRYTMPIDDKGYVKSSTHVHAYSERGFGGGQDFLWDNPETGHKGGITGFYVSDQDIYPDEQDEAERSAVLTDENRYRFRLKHSGAITEADRFWLDMSYLSDPWVTKDFFRREYREAATPDNRAVLSHRGEEYVASLLLQPRWNDFYTVVTRLPEARLDSALDLGGSGFYYETENQAASLEKLYEEILEDEDYSAARLDTYHVLYYPMRFSGFLNVTPSAAYRGTYYSKTRGDPVTSTNWVTRAAEDGTLTTAAEETVTQAEADAELRNLFTLGLDASFRAFKVLDEGENNWGRGFRHVGEPYAEYELTPKPNLRPENIYQFDSIDELDRAHQVYLGMRNKLQTRRVATPRPQKEGEDVLRVLPDDARPGSGQTDLIYADVYNLFRLETEEEESALGPFFADIRLRPAGWFQMRFDAEYEWDTSVLTTFGARASLVGPDQTSVSLEYRIDEGVRDQVGVVADLFPERRWSLLTYQRYDFENGIWSEQGYLIRRRFDCIALGLGFRYEPSYANNESDDFRVWASFDLLAMPGRRFSSLGF
jgi:LPS-assembly protein